MPPMPQTERSAYYLSRHGGDACTQITADDVMDAIAQLMRSYHRPRDSRLTADEVRVLVARC